jgi:hypothetical protein
MHVTKGSSERFRLRLAIDSIDQLPITCNETDHTEKREYIIGLHVSFPSPIALQLPATSPFTIPFTGFVFV